MLTHLKVFTHTQPFLLESGDELASIELGYSTYGSRNKDDSNIVWICHALTANSKPHEWWPGLVGEGLLYDPKKHYIVCANILGSCYGSTNPTSIDPKTGKRYGRNFPVLTIRDIVKSLQLLKDHLGIGRVAMATGGSMGGQQVLEWAIQDPMLFEHICVIGTNAKHSPWGVAFNAAQRMALEADESFGKDGPFAGKKGLEAARAIAMLSYRNYETYHRTQMDSEEKIDDYKASSYQRYQGLKLSNRFDPLTYFTLSKAMDSHDLGRGRGGVPVALAKVKAKALVIGVQTDFLFPPREQVVLNNHIPNSEIQIIDSPFGHDGFLIESKQIAKRVRSFMGWSA